MAQYTNRTCSNCGIRKPQPEMHQEVIYTEVAKSKKGISGATVAGAVLGYKKSGDAVGSWLFNTGQRNYQRKKTVWMCGSCSTVKKSSGGRFVGNTIKFLFVLFIASVVVDIIAPDTNKPNTTQTP